jgi:electron transfer flavoprotein alpha/beta subunit
MAITIRREADGTELGLQTASLTLPPILSVKEASDG